MPRVIRAMCSGLDGLRSKLEILFQEVRICWQTLKMQCHDRNSVKKDHRGGALIRMDGNKAEVSRGFPGK